MRALQTFVNIPQLNVVANLGLAGVGGCGGRDSSRPSTHHQLVHRGDIGSRSGPGYQARHLIRGQGSAWEGPQMPQGCDKTARCMGQMLMPRRIQRGKHHGDIRRANRTLYPPCALLKADSICGSTDSKTNTSPPPDLFVKNCLLSADTL